MAVVVASVAINDVACSLASRVPTLSIIHTAVSCLAGPEEAVDIGSTAGAEGDQANNQTGAKNSHDSLKGEI
jgi:hypothetical protein